MQKLLPLSNKGCRSTTVLTLVFVADLFPVFCVVRPDAANNAGFLGYYFVSLNRYRVCSCKYHWQFDGVQ